MISSLSWVPRGASKSKPLRYELSQRELEEMVREQGIVGADVSSDDEEVQEGNEAEGVSKEEPVGAAEGTGVDQGDTELPSELRMDEYDDEPTLTMVGNPSGNADIDAENAMDEDRPEVEAGEDEEDEDVAVNLVEEPSTGQVFAYESEDEDSDTEDNIIKPSDHVLLTTTTEEDEQSALEIHVYTGDTGTLYVHHDITLPALPLCLAWMDIPPRTPAMLVASGSADEGHTLGSYCAVGTFEPAIEIWNLDVLDPLEPTATLGGYSEKQKKPGKKARKRQTVPGSHTDAVLSLSWNKEHRHVLASGSADNTVKVWDVTTQQCSATLTHHRDKVQGVAWHPVEATVIATMGYDGTFAYLDARAPTKVSSFSLGADPECLLWNPHNPAQVLTGLEDGVICCRDVREATKPVYSFTAHERGVSSMSFAPLVPGMLATCSEDKTVKVWDVDADVPLQVSSKSMAVGRLFTMQYDASSPFLMATAGSKGHVALWHSDEDQAISARFSSRVQSTSTSSSGDGTTGHEAVGSAQLGGFLANIGEDTEGGDGDGVEEGKAMEEDGRDAGGASESKQKKKKKKNKNNKA